MNLPLHVFDVKIKTYIDFETGTSGRFAIYSVRFTESETSTIEKLEDLLNKF